MLLIVDSPKKAATISSLLDGAKVIATRGSLKELPKFPLSVDLTTYEPTFAYVEKNAGIPDALRAAAQNEKVMLACAPDVEGYAINWQAFEEIKGVASEVHLLELHEVTKDGIEQALAQAVPFDRTDRGPLDAFLARTVGDRLVSYILTPAILKDLKASFNIGMTQSLAIRLVVDREREIREFQPTTFCIPTISLTKSGVTFTARHVVTKFDQLADGQALVDHLAVEKDASAEKVETTEVIQPPGKPFSTSDLLNAANARLNFTLTHIMGLAQDLYDLGIITFPLTESVRMSPGFADSIHSYIRSYLGPEYIPAECTAEITAETGAEGIRPTRMHPTAEISAIISSAGLSSDHKKLYEMVFRRAVASQLAPARFVETSMIFSLAGEQFIAYGREMSFDGHLRVYAEVTEERWPTVKEGVPLQTLPAIEIGELVQKVDVLLEEQRTTPRRRYTPGSLIKELERRGMGRPLTYRMVAACISDRQIADDKGFLVPLPRGEKLMGYLQDKHPWILDSDLTRKMEQFLNLVAENKEPWSKYCRGVHSKMGFAAQPEKKIISGPTPSQLNYAQDLAKKYNITIPEGALQSGKELSAWIRGVLANPPAVNPEGSPAKPSQTVPKPAQEGNRGGGEAPPPDEFEPVGNCPVCGKAVREEDKAFKCSANCGFILSKNKLEKFGKEMTFALMKRFLGGGKVLLRNLSSTEKGTVFDAHGILSKDERYGWGITLIFDLEKPEKPKAPRERKGTRSHDFDRQW